DLVEPPTLPAAYGVASLGSFDGVRRRRFGPGVGTGGFELVLPWWRAIAGEQKEPEQLRRRQCVSDGGVRAGQDDPGARAAVGQSPARAVQELRGPAHGAERIQRRGLQGQTCPLRFTGGETQRCGGIVSRLSDSR